MKDKATENSTARPNKSEAEPPKQQEKNPCSPRANVAYSILPVVDWVRNTLRRVSSAPPKTTKAEVRVDRISILRERAKLI